MFDYRRSYNCGTLNSQHINKEVTLSGWVNRRRDHGGLIFIDLRDRFGITQLVFSPETSKNTHDLAAKLRSEWVISIKGKVIPRSEGMTNSKMATGEIEVDVSQLEILSQAKTPPFSICDEQIEVNEEARLKYRYLDIRRGQIIDKLLMRHKAMLACRNFLDKENFTEVSTPILSKSTPEGARDYLVPSRIYPGNFYALPQSPQIFKQLLMISGMDRYFQIAPCFRDEDLRADRQPEFHQIDMEMSFGYPDDLFAIIEKMMAHIFSVCLGVNIPTPFMRMTYKDCMEKYGCDKPDLRFGMPLVRLDAVIEKSEFSVLKDVLKNGGVVKAFCVKNASDLSRRKVDDFASFVKPFGLAGVAWMRYTDEGLTSSITKFFSKDLLDEIINQCDMQKDDLLLIAGGSEGVVNQSLDHLRRHVARIKNLIPKNSYKFLWVTDFPLFTIDKETQNLASEHHPFTSPLLEDLPLLDSKPLKMRSSSYDLVLNGYEMASGSQRIHDFSLQRKIFQLLKLSEEDINRKFGYFISALQYGTPPHLGAAVGFDRLVMILCNTENIRDVVAFPKTQKASDLMQEAPSIASKEQLKELGIKVDTK